MTQMRVPVELVAVATTLLDPNEEALGNEVSDDLLGRALADYDAILKGDRIPRTRKAAGTRLDINTGAEQHATL